MKQESFEILPDVVVLGTFASLAGPYKEAIMMIRRDNALQCISIQKSKLSNHLNVEELPDGIDSTYVIPQHKCFWWNDFHGWIRR